MNRDLAAVLLTALLVYALRLSGLLLGERIPRSGPARRVLDALPGAVFAALVAPGILAAGWPGLAAAGGIFLCVRKTGNVLLAMLLGVALVALLRR